MLQKDETINKDIYTAHLSQINETVQQKEPKVVFLVGIARQPKAMKICGCLVCYKRYDTKNFLLSK